MVRKTSTRPSHPTSFPFHPKLGVGGLHHPKADAERGQSGPVAQGGRVVTHRCRQESMAFGTSWLWLNWYIIVLTMVYSYLVYSKLAIWYIITELVAKLFFSYLVGGLEDEWIFSYMIIGDNHPN